MRRVCCAQLTGYMLFLGCQNQPGMGWEPYARILPIDVNLWLGNLEFRHINFNGKQIER